MARELQLEQRGALDQLAEALAQASSDAVRIEVVHGCSVVNLRGPPADQSLITDAQRVLGIDLPLVPNRWHGDDRLAAVWLGPDEWLIVAHAGGSGRIEQAMRQARPADPWLSVVDVSHSSTRISLSGPAARDLLAKCCALDLCPDVFSPGSCAQTILAGSYALMRAIDRNSFEIWVRNSFARYIAEWLLDGCAAAQLRGGYRHDSWTSR